MKNGTHYIIDAYKCNKKKLNSVEFIKKTLIEILENQAVEILRKSRLWIYFKDLIINCMNIDFH